MKRMIDPTEQEINEIRLKIYEETKDMTPAEINEYYRKSTAMAAKKYGFNPSLTLNPQELHRIR